MSTTRLASPGGKRRSAWSRAAVFLVALVLSLTTACTAGTAGNTNTGGTSGSGGSGRYLNMSPCCSWQATWSFNPYNVNGVGFNDFVQMRLAILKSPSLTEFEPQLAEKWEVADGKFVVHLRANAKWQDDTPLTSKDLVDTAYLNGTRGDGFWNTISHVEAVDDHSVAFTLREGQNQDLAILAILPNIIVYPSHIYGSFVTDALKADVDAYNAAFNTDPVAAGKMAEFKRMGDTFQKLAALEVPKLIGNGPFQLENITTKQAKLNKWDGFWAAENIKVPGMNYYNGDNQVIYPQMFNDQADFTNVYMPPPIVERWKNQADTNLALPLAFGFVMGFNSSKYPLTMVEVRQALAYVIPRQKLSDAAYGSGDGAGGTAKDVITGLSPTLDKLYLTEEQIGQLNPYPEDTAKATELLTSKGFTKNGSQWMTPEGKPFTLTLTVNSQTTDIVTSFTSAADALTAFGIKSEVKATTGAQQDADQHNGNFDIGMYFIGGDNPIGMFNNMMGPGQNFSSQGNYAGKKGIGFGPEIEVPGLGKVNVPNTLTKQLQETGPDKMGEVSWQWAQVVNQQVPYIWYATKVYQFSYSSKHYDNWPPIDEATGTSPLWDIIGANMSGGLSLAMQQGYIVPK